MAVLIGTFSSGRHKICGGAERAAGSPKRWRGRAEAEALVPEADAHRQDLAREFHERFVLLFERVDA